MVCSIGRLMQFRAGQGRAGQGRAGQGRAEQRRAAKFILPSGTVESPMMCHGHAPKHPGHYMCLQVDIACIGTLIA